MPAEYDSLSNILGSLRASPRDRQGRLLNNPEYAFKALVAGLGDLSAVTANYSGNDFEELSKAVGAILCSTVALAESYRVDPNTAVTAYLSGPSAVTPRKSLRVDAVAASNVAPSTNELLLSPRTATNFFPELDRFRSKSRADYHNELAWFIVRENGEVFDLKPNGRNIPVLYDELPYYFALAETHRVATAPSAISDVRVNNPPNVVESNATPVQRVTKTLQVNAPGYNPQQEAALFSPTHFDNGLFAPLNNNTSVQVTYGGATESPPAALNRAPTGNNSSQNRASSNGSPSAAGNEVDRFWSLIAMIERQEISRADVANCGLTFSVPTLDGLPIELVAGGSKITVNRNNVDSFLNAVKEKMSNRSQDTTRVMRTGSMRPMVVTNVPYNPVVDEGKFSPSHFTGNLFAPFNSNTTVTVDLNNQDLVPSVLRNNGGSYNQTLIAPPQQVAAGAAAASSAATGSSSGSAADGLSAALRNFRQKSARQPTFPERIRNSDDEFVAILSQIDGDHEKVSEFGVTFCIPTACVNKSVLASKPSSNSDGIFDLVPNGRNVFVTPASVPDYFSLIEGAAKV